MNTNTKPVASLGALLAAITETIAAAEQRIMVRLDDIENRIVGLEDKITEVGKQADEIKDEILNRIEGVQKTVDTFDTSKLDGAVEALGELADAERRRGLNEIRDDIRMRRVS